MKKACKTLCSLLVGIAALLGPATTSAQSDFDPLSANIEENIAKPEVNPKHSEAVKTAIKQLVSALRQAGYDVTTVRKGEVAMVTLPCSALFQPNSTQLRDAAAKKLSPMAPYISRHDNYKVILAVHSDDTGDSQHADNITANRANAIDEFYYKLGSDAETGIIPYGLGSDEPVAPNTGVANRAQNRRVEIYFVPTEEFIKKARKSK